MATDERGIATGSTCRDADRSTRRPCSRRRWRRATRRGANVLFVGTTRGVTGGVVDPEPRLRGPRAAGAWPARAAARRGRAGGSASRPARSCIGSERWRSGEASVAMRHERPASPRGVRRGRVAHGADQARRCRSGSARRRPTAARVGASRAARGGAQPMSDAAGATRWQPAAGSSTASAACTPTCASASPTAATCGAPTACRSTRRSSRGRSCSPTRRSPAWPAWPPGSASARSGSPAANRCAGATRRARAAARRRCRASRTWRSRPTACCSPSRPRALRRAGLHRLNVSLDSLRRGRVREDRPAARARPRARRPGGREGRRASRRSASTPSRSAGSRRRRSCRWREFCRREGFHLRFIEFMPLDAEAGWSNGAGAVRRRGAGDPRAASWARSCPRRRGDPGQPAGRLRAGPTASAAWASSTR